jgi:hypothetical protein
MKRFSVIFMVIVFSLGFTRDVYPGVFGIKGGVNFARVSNLKAENLFHLDLDFGTKHGLIIGCFYRFDLGASFSIQPEVYFSMKGTKATGEFSAHGVPRSYDVRLKLNYLEFPILMKYKFPANGKLKPSLFAGPYLGFNSSAKFFVRGESMGIEKTGEEDISHDVKNTEFGITVGASLDYDIGHSSIIIDVRYSFGLTGIYDDPIPVSVSVPDPDTPVSKNGVFSLMLGFAF